MRGYNQRMAKLKMKEATKELNQRSGAILAEVERVKRNADIMLQMLRQQEMLFVRMEEEERNRIKSLQQQELMRQQTKAWTMPDDDVAEVMEAVEAPAPVEKVEVKPAELEVPAATEVVEEPVAVEAPAPKAEEVAAEETPAEQVEPRKTVASQPKPAPAAASRPSAPAAPARPAPQSTPAATAA